MVPARPMPAAYAAWGEVRASLRIEKVLGVIQWRWNENIDIKIKNGPRKVSHSLRLYTLVAADSGCS